MKTSNMDLIDPKNVNFLTLLAKIIDLTCPTFGKKEPVQNFQKVNSFLKQQNRTILLDGIFTD